MVVLAPQSEFGVAPPPTTPYSIVSNIPLWENSRKFRDGDMSVAAKLKHIYPRFGPTHYVAQVRPPRPTGIPPPPPVSHEGPHDANRSSR